MRPPVNNQPTLNSQLMGAQGAQPMYIPQAFGYPTAYAPNNAIIYNQAALQYPAMTGNFRQYGNAPAVYFTAPNLSYNPNARGSAPPVATVPVQAMTSTSLSQQPTMMANQIATAPTQQAAPVAPRRSHALTIRDPVTKEAVQIDRSVDASETVSFP